MKYKTTCFFLLLLMLGSAYAQPGPQIQNIRICALRVEFKEDNNELTTGNGKFMIDTVTTDPYAIDPAPHNRIYFQDQIQAVANYFNKVSEGKVMITGDVFPQKQDSAYELQHTMGYYNPNTTDAAINEGIAQLFIDAVVAAETDDDIVFDDYDLVVVFHAGVGQDIALDYDPTPQDISSLFVTLDFMKKWISEAIQGAPADSGFITQGIVLPETENQEGEKIALTGMFASNIGTYLGLYDLFSPSKQRSGVGRFDLMDSGLLNLNGLAPSPPGAFSRKKLGWVKPVQINQPADSIKIARFFGSQKQEVPEVIQIPINDDEYYLLEFRGNHAVNIDSLFIEILDDRDEYPSYLEVLKTYYPDQIEMGQSGVLLSLPDYDWGLPGSGILIWHIDERVIAEKGPMNKINDDPDYRGVDIEEADGSQDIGQIYSFLEPGYQTELGWLGDFWFKNRPKEIKNFELYENKFSTNTAPNTRANLNNAVSHITIENFSDNISNIMTFDYKRDVYEQGFPVTLFNSNAVTLYSVAGSSEGNANDFLFVINSAGEIYAVSKDNNVPVGLLNERLMIGKVENTGGVTSLALVDTNDTPGANMLVVSSGNIVTGLSLSEVNGSGLAHVLFETELSGDATGPVVQAGQAIFIPCLDNKINKLNFAGHVVDMVETNHQVNDVVVYPGETIPASDREIAYSALAHLKSADEYNLIIYDNNENTFHIYNADGSVFSEFKILSNLTGQFIVADMDNNKVPDIVFVLKDGIYAYNIEGFPVSGFPIRPRFMVNDSLCGTPLATDTNNDGVLDLICSSQNGQVIVYSVTGQPVQEYQLSTGGRISVPPLVMQLDSDEELELVAVTDNGNVYAWQLSALYNSDNNLWLQANYNSGNNVILNAYSEYQPISNTLIPSKKCYNYPNPNLGDYTNIRYYLNEPATVKIRILDPAGILVDEFNGPGYGQTDNEIPWNVSGVASGVYLCQVEAKSQSKTETRLIKIMVIH